MTRFAILLVLSAALPASAAMVTYEFSGAVKYLSSDVGQYIPIVVGDPIFGEFTADLDQDTTLLTGEIGVTGRVAYTETIVDFNLVVGGDHFQFTDGSTSQVQLRNNLTPSSDIHDQISIEAMGLEGAGITLDSVSLLLRDFDTLRLIDDLSLDNLADINFIEHDGDKHQRLASIKITSSDFFRFDWQTLERTAFIEDPALSGDANGDGQVTAYDLNVIGLNWQLPGEWEDGDFTGDGFVDAADLNALAINWRSSQPAAIPEPSAALLAISPEGPKVTSKN